MFFCILKVTEGFLYGSNSVSGSSLDPLVRGTDPRIRMRTKMSRIRNTACRAYYNVFSLPLRYPYLFLFVCSNGFITILL
jgi:hypothetical protein